MLLASGLSDQRAVDEPVEEDRVNLIEWELLRLGRKVLLCRLDIRKMELGSIDARVDRVARRKRARRRRAGALRRCGPISRQQDVAGGDTGKEPGRTHQAERRN